MSDVLIAIPVYNERIALEGSVRQVHVDSRTRASRVKAASTALADLRGVARLLVHRGSSQTHRLLSPKHPMLAP